MTAGGHTPRRDATVVDEYDYCTSECHARVLACIFCETPTCLRMLRVRVCCESARAPGACQPCRVDCRVGKSLERLSFPIPLFRSRTRRRRAGGARRTCEVSRLRLPSGGPTQSCLVGRKVTSASLGGTGCRAGLASWSSWSMVQAQRVPGCGVHHHLQIEASVKPAQNPRAH